jgi:uncharacterized membrane protein
VGAAPPAPGLNRIGATGLLALAYGGGAIAMWGVYFDTSWHRTLSRDSFWSLPHTYIYGGGFIVWVAAVLAVVLASRGRLPDLGGVRYRVGPVTLPFGFTLAGAGVLMVLAVAAPMDAWWHAAFGKDVLIWSPPHLVALLGGATAATGLLFAAAGQRGKGTLTSPLSWKLMMLPPLVHLIFSVHFTLAHYTMTAATRTADFYPFLVALSLPAVFVAAARAVGPWAAPAAAALFFIVTVAVDLALRAMDFERYTITPVVAVPAIAFAVAYARCRRAAAGPRAAVVSALAFAIVFVLMETAWMAGAVGKPWPLLAVIVWLPRTLAAAVMSGWIGWVAGGFLLAQATSNDVGEIFGARARARRHAISAGALLLLAMAAMYRPQTFGPPLRVDEMALAPTERFPVQEAVFWEAVLDDDWGKVPRLEVYSEGIIDGIPLPVGPAWCAPDDAALARDLPRLRFGMQVNGTDVDLSPYPLVLQRLLDGRACGWVGVVSQAQRASRNTFVYTVTPLNGAPPTLTPIRVEATVVFKDP